MNPSDSGILNAICHKHSFVQTLSTLFTVVRSPEVACYSQLSNNLYVLDMEEILFFLFFKVMTSPTKCHCELSP
jgi:hypothetical protein